MGGVAVVTDSTCDLPLELAESRGLRVVPMTVAFGDDVLISRVTISDEDFYSRLEQDNRSPTTSQPSPVWFEEAYADAADEGFDSVVSIHVSSELSGTCALAEKVAADAPIPVIVVDSGQVSGSLALAVLRAGRVAESALAGADDVAEAARDVAGAARIFFVVDTLEYLRRGGRLSGAQALLGGVLQVKPILTLDEGRVQMLEKARTFRRATERVVELASDVAAGGPVDVVISHGLAPERAAALSDQTGSMMKVASQLQTVVGPVVGAHCGPGAVAIAVAPAT